MRKGCGRMNKYLILNGPNLNMLGVRDPNVYGTESLEDIERNLRQAAEELGISIDFYQSNHEGQLIDRLHQAYGMYTGIVINAGAFTHYSYAIRDALAAIRIPFVEVHISNIHAREDFRHHSVLAPIAEGQIAGLGTYGYELALRAIVKKTK
jgi:3-dehydroquinate dehydratase II